MKFSTYSPEGRFLRVCDAPESAVPSQSLEEGEHDMVVDYAAGPDEYFDLDTYDVMPKAPLDVVVPTGNPVVGVTWTISNVPPNTPVEILGGDQHSTMIVNDGSLELLFDSTGTYVVIFDAVRFVRTELEVTVDAA